MASGRRRREFEQWVATATDRDLQVLLLEATLDTRDKIETIRSIVVVSFVLSLVGALLAIIAAANSTSDTLGIGIIAGF